MNQNASADHIPTSGSTKIIALHGWTYDVEPWKPFLHELELRNISTTLLRTPGLTAPLSEPWTLTQYVQWLYDQLKSKDQPVVLLGHSFGGQIAIRFARMYPERVQQLILLDSSGIRVNTIRARVKRAAFYVIAKIGFFLKGFKLARTLLYKLAHEHDYEKTNDVMKKTMQQVLSDEVVNDLPKIACPTTILWGEHDTVTPRSLAENFHAHIQNSSLHFIKDARHSPHYTHPAVVAKYIESVLFGVQK